MSHRLLEVMIVTVILGVLTIVGVQVLTKGREEARVTTLKAQLREIATLQEAYYASHLRYADDPEDLGWKPAAGVRVEISLESLLAARRDTGEPPEAGRRADKDGWTARATHPQLSVVCAIFVGSVRPFEPARREGEVKCR